MCKISGAPAPHHPPTAASCISCGAPYGSAHYAWCKFTVALRLLWRAA